VDASNKPLIREILSCLAPNIHANIDLENLKEKAAARVSSTLERLPTCPARRGKGMHGTKVAMAEKDLTLQDSPQCFRIYEERATDVEELAMVREELAMVREELAMEREERREEEERATEELAMVREELVTVREELAMVREELAMVHKTEVSMETEAPVETEGPPVEMESLFGEETNVQLANHGNTGSVDINHTPHPTQPIMSETSAQAGPSSVQGNLGFSRLFEKFRSHKKA
jgi:hypothetical protein